MKKTVFIISIVLSVTALLFWLGCNPFNDAKKDAGLNFKVLDESGSSRLILYCSITVNGSTYDGSGESLSIDPTAGYDTGMNPVFFVTNGTVKNVNIVTPAGEGIYIYGNCSIDNVNILDMIDRAVTVKKTGTSVISNCTFNNSADKVIQVNDICTITLQNVSSTKAYTFMRQNGMTTWKMTSYCNDCTIMDMSTSIFRSDSTRSIFYYHNLNTNCSVIGYPGTNAVEY